MSKYQRLKNRYGFKRSHTKLQLSLPVNNLAGHREFNCQKCIEDAGQLKLI